jgi:NAD(P)-dependent dehydrogenase (short-subunit alcohol dehydrogenase family)
MNRLASKVAVITGGALGLGRATAMRMAQEGAAVAILDVRDEDGRALAADLTGEGLSAAYWRCNVASGCCQANAKRSPAKSA